MPALQAYLDQHKSDGLEVLAISMDEARDVPAVRKLAQQFTFEVALKADANFKGLGRIWRMPTTFVIDRADNPHKRRWRKHSDEFKARVVALALEPHASMTSVALANGINANMLRCWVCAASSASFPSTVAHDDRNSQAMSFVQLPIQVDKPLVAARAPATSPVCPPKTAATSGDAAAQFQFSLLYDSGRGTPHDAKAALYWLRLSATHGNPQAQSNLGVAFSKGRGVVQDLIRAYTWFAAAAAAASGDSVAITNRDVVARKLTEQQVSQAKALLVQCQSSGLTSCL